MDIVIEQVSGAIGKHLRDFRLVPGFERFHRLGEFFFAALCLIFRNQGLGCLLQIGFVNAAKLFVSFVLVVVCNLKPKVAASRVDDDI